ncbi:PDZ domain-containing protein [Nocardioides sp. DS6]|uniref:endopeptidase La n=1 Tax=Nocardioides eburneus TaxID=3231482 RepID=A0ABV3T0L9_9ACTN
MTHRTLAGLIALPLVLLLVVLAWVVPLPFTIYSPGPTVNVLGDYQGQPIVHVDGHKAYRDAGELRMTTVSETTRTAKLGLWALLQAWVSKDDAVYPLSVAYPDVHGTTKGDRQQGALDMATAQDDAVAAALEKLGYHVGSVVAVAQVTAKAPAAGVLKTGDKVRKINGTSVKTPDQAVKAVQSVKPGDVVRLTVQRGHRTMTTKVTSGRRNGKAYLGVGLGTTYDFPFDVRIGIDPTIGGPSAGLMMALSVYDTLTPGSLTGGDPVAGTGTIDEKGQVGAIGGIQQKIPAAQHDGAKLFLVPADNCQDVVGADRGDMRLVKVSTFDGALSAIQTWVKDHGAPLPSCGSGA